MIPRTPVFVYGTLRPGQPAFKELRLAERVVCLGPATVAGTLYDLGDYPGAILGDSGVIAGELLMPRDDAVFTVLDAFELFNPQNPDQSEYLRVQTMTSADEASAWIYVYNFALNGARSIPSGDWSDRD